MVRGSFVKFITVLCLVLLSLTCLLTAVVIIFPIDEAIGDEIVFASLKAFLLISVIAMVLYATVGIPEDKVELLKYPLDFSDFNFFADHIETELYKKSYVKLRDDICFDKACIKSYFRDKTGDLYIVVSTDEFTKDVLENINKIYFNYIITVVSDKIDAKKLRLNSILCVKKVSNLFYNFIKMQNDNNIREFRFRAGISFGGKKIYLPDRYYGLGKSQMEYMNLEFRQIMGLNKIEGSNKTGNTGDGTGQ